MKYISFITSFLIMFILFRFMWPILLLLLGVMLLSFLWFTFKARSIVRDNFDNNNEEEKYTDLNDYEEPQSNAEIIDAEYKEKEIK